VCGLPARPQALRRPAHGYADTLADDLAGLMTALDLRRAPLVSHSMGSGEVVRYLARHGADRMARVVLLAPTTPILVSITSPTH